ncbi:translocation/assembly module TamB domain-containing protein [Novosphingobium sp. 1949]|uniref:Translocation/assembly module TamB domain-containing protein n=1 Tax=Novosphingobium organovorum TaxID=2930092 RepID=A0ABT0B9U1_9SPHN|nr:translocation/assembly module TamB domain-containing protein [Novosphingobium organovorum]MCJ2181840.1 translocation/assembly module TamB domain-containing protein [Novosphingobium organovorum]
MADDTMHEPGEGEGVAVVSGEESAIGTDNAAGVEPRARTIGQRVRSRLLKTIVAAVLGIVVLGAALIFGIDTGPGHRFVAEQIAALSFENGMRIRVGRIEGSLYGKMSLHDLSVYDTKGEFLFAPEIDVDWRPFAYLEKHVDVRSATAAKMILRRSPVFKPTPPSEGPLLPDLDIDIGELRIDQFVAEAPVSGKLRIMTVSGKTHIANGRAEVEAKGATVAIAGKEGGDRFDVTLDAVPDKNRLAIDLDLQAPTGGVIAALSGFTQPLALKVSGKGDWKTWNGALKGSYGSKPLADLTLAARDGTFHVKGPTEVARLVSGPTAALLGPITEVDLTAALAERRMTLSGQVSSDAFRLVPKGLVDFSDNTFEDLQLDFALLKPAVMAPELKGSGLDAHVTLDGAFATPKVAYAISASRLVMNGMGLEALRAQGEARVDADQILIPVSARVARITGLDSVAGGKLDNVTLAGDLAIKGTRILSDNLRLKSDRIDAKVLVVADMSTGLYTGAIDGRIDRYEIASVGVFTIATDMDLKSKGGAYALEGTVKARSTKLLNENLNTYLGGNFAVSSRVHYGSDGVARFSGLALSAPYLTVRGGSGMWSPDGRIAFDANATSQQYGAIGVRVRGSIANPDAHLTAEHPGLGIGLANLDARVTGAKNGYRLNLTSDTDYGPLKGDVTLEMGKAMAVQINSANLSGVDFAGRLVQTKAGPFEGQLTAKGNGIGGVVDLAAQDRYQAATFHLRAKDTVFDGPAKLAIGSAIIDGRTVLYDQPLVEADAQLSGTHFGDYDLAAARVLIDYRDGKGKAKALVEGVSGIPFRLGINAEMQPELWRVALNGRMRGQSVKTLSPARITIKDGTYELLPTALSIGGGTLRVSGRYGDGYKLESRLEGLDLAMANSFMPGLGLGGTINGSFDFEQASPSAFPRADARLTLTNFTRTSSTTVSEPVNVAFVGKLLPDGGEARAVIRERGSVVGRMVTSLRPLPPGDGPWMTRLLQAPLSGGIRYNGPADTLFSFAGQPGQSLTGSVGMAADFSCQLADPCLKGIVKGRDLTYENQAYGTKLSDMALSGSFDGSQFKLDSLTANAGDGTLSASGSVSLAAADGYPMDFTVKLDKARLAKSNALSASATGTLNFTKKAKEPPLLSGTIRLPETRYKIVREGAAQVPALTGVRFKPRRGPARVTGDEEAETLTGAFGNIRLDLHVKAPEKLYVSGMGLESEWSADFTVGGTSSEPTMSGNINLVRGTLGFAGRSFELSEGKIAFNGGRTIDPTIDLTATETIDDVEVSVVVSGQAYNPEIDFSSSPSLPDDEIVSRILFGSSVANLSAIQAVQLASSLNSLRGTGGGLNPLGTLRSATGVDRLRILGADETTGRGTALAAGQYLTDDIYVEIITDARGFTATQLEISVTKWLSVLSQAGGSGVNSASVRIKKDY